MIARCPRSHESRFTASKPVWSSAIGAATLVWDGYSDCTVAPWWHDGTMSRSKKRGGCEQTARLRARRKSYENSAGATRIPQELREFRRSYESVAGAARIPQGLRKSGRS